MARCGPKRRPGKIEIGAQSNIQDGTIAHATGGFSTVRIGESDGWSSCTSTWLYCRFRLFNRDGRNYVDNCHIHSGSIIGAGSVVTSGTTIPSGVLALGSPAKVIRPLTPNERLGWIGHGCAEYLRLAKKYKR